MEQKELYELAKKLTTKDVVYLAASHLEHIKTMEYGGTINADDRVFEVHVSCKLKP